MNTTSPNTTLTLPNAEKRTQLDIRIDKIRARKRELAQKDKAYLRTREANRRNVVGRFFLEVEKKDTRIRELILRTLDSHQSNDAERALFELKPLESRPASATAESEGSSSSQLAASRGAHSDENRKGAL